jgi:hypothetical protein
MRLRIFGNRTPEYQPAIKNNTTATIMPIRPGCCISEDAKIKGTTRLEANTISQKTTKPFTDGSTLGFLVATFADSTIGGL